MGFLDAFTGGAQKRDIQGAKGAADAALDKGYATAMPMLDNAQQYYSQYAHTGGQANAMYSDALGLNGQPAQQTVVDNFAGDPFRQSNEDFANKQLKSTFNARDGLYGGNAMLAAARGSLERGSTDWNKWLDRLAGEQSMGVGVAGGQAGLEGQKADLAYGYGATKAGNEIQYGNAMASARGIGVNNLLNVAGTAVKAFTPTYSGQSPVGNAMGWKPRV